MLKSYKSVQRWYPALEPEYAVPPLGSVDSEPVDEDGDAAAPRYPHYIRDTEPEPFDIPFTGEPATRRSEFFGGWSDWVDRAPGPDDDYPVREGDVVRLTWDCDTVDAPRTRRRPRSASGDGDDAEGSGEPDRRSNPHERAEAGGDEETEWILPSRREGGGDRVIARAQGIASPLLRDYARPSRLLLTLAVAVGVLLLMLTAVGGIALHLAHSNAHERRSMPAAVIEPATGADPGILRLTSEGGVRTVAASRTAAHCPTERSDRVVRGADVGGTGSGPDAIMWFQHAFYVERSAERALEVVAPGAYVSPAEVIQRGIDSVPLGTDFCVRVVTLAGNRYSVEVTERRPAAAPATYDKQLVTTAVVGGRTLITGITAG
ncbi:MAG: hypothetical protein J2P18_06300 [Nocardia sp.]|nr:hypothetical protein [Nocardia sp.]